MKGVILAGGVGSRLRPVTYLLNKNLLPVYDKPGIFYSIDLFKKAGIKDICIVAENHFLDDFRYLLGNGTDFGVRLVYENDSPLKKGPASALNHAREFANGSNIALVFADGIFDVDISNQVREFKEGAHVFLKPVEDPSSFGIFETDQYGKVISIEEKPEKPKSNLATTGLALYDKTVFDKIDRIKPGLKGEYYTVQIDEQYLSEGKLKASILEGFWQDMGTFDGLFKASQYWYNKKKLRKDIAKKTLYNTKKHF
ncbi:MAG TPA: spore coat protein [candidate division WWE3 bacterium]|uniref:glucose-1-phosphate thymidylyltransferase n=1 Tax=candidate division WWE3 bacterium TaxID=2053526 RepID=A0A7V5J2H7_UNCKA|nr:spore coat protein [candidate division WWE3 bacterium]